jgi:AbrB family looped-hinge helix DNA binding protein
MPTSTVTSKGQVTIPKEVRDALRIGSGDRVAFILREDGVVEMRPETVDLKDLYGVLKRTGKPVTIEAMNEAIAESAAERFERSKRS